MLEKNIFTLANAKELVTIFRDNISDIDLKNLILGIDQPVSLFLELGIIDRTQIYDMFPNNDCQEMNFNGSKMILVENILLADELIDNMIFVFRLLSNSNNQVYLLAGKEIHITICKVQKNSFFKIKKNKDILNLSLKNDQKVIMSDYDGNGIFIIKNK